jgi:hypothetical protein
VCRAVEVLGGRRGVVERPTLDDSTKSKPTDLHELDGWGFRHPQALRSNPACHSFDKDTDPSRGVGSNLLPMRLAHNGKLVLFEVRQTPG